ncbi:MAG: hypothetical protein IAE82_09355 [Opitutaceae bacterium]|nr:hypothetical protein [Opitutaceae bacterium]
MEDESLHDLRDHGCGDGEDARGAGDPGGDVRGESRAVAAAVSAKGAPRSADAPVAAAAAINARYPPGASRPVVHLAPTAAETSPTLPKSSTVSPNRAEA